MILFRAGVDISLWQTAENNLKIELLKIYEIGFQRFYEIGFGTTPISTDRKLSRYRL